MTNPTDKAPPNWNDVRQIADELELKIHLAGMEARDRWGELKPRLVELEATIDRAGKRVGTAITDQLASLGSALRKLRDDISGVNGPRANP